jgi:predicted kinase
MRPCPQRVQVQRRSRLYRVRGPKKVDMMDQLFHTPSAPDFRVDWAYLHDTYDWVRRLKGCPQDPIHHAEGDVWIHSKMVCEAMAALPQYRALDKDSQRLLFAAALLHDVAKPDCTVVEPDGRVTARGHSRQGEFMGRVLLWRLGFPFALREQAVTMIRYHQVPFHILDREDPRKMVYRISQTTRCDLLSHLAESDLRGRKCEDAQRVLDSIALFRELCQEEACYDKPKKFMSDHSRYLYFKKDGRDPDYMAFDDTWGEVTMLCGLPGSGKNKWISENHPKTPVVSFDDIRKDLGIAHHQNQGPVISEADARARALLRAKKPFIWNATSLQKQMRSSWLELFTDYHAKVKIVYVEVPERTLWDQNQQRKGNAVVPWEVIERMAGRLEIPDPTEAHTVEYAVTDK